MRRRGLVLCCRGAALAADAAAVPAPLAAGKRLGSLAVLPFQQFVNAGMCVAYVVVAGQSLQVCYAALRGDGGGADPGAPLWAFQLGFGTCLALLVPLPDLGSLHWVMGLGAATTVGFSLLAVVGAALQGKSRGGTAALGWPRPDRGPCRGAGACRPWPPAKTAGWHAPPCAGPQPGVSYALPSGSAADQAFGAMTSLGAITLLFGNTVSELLVPCLCPAAHVAPHVAPLPPRLPRGLAPLAPVPPHARLPRPAARCCSRRRPSSEATPRRWLPCSKRHGWATPWWRRWCWRWWCLATSASAPLCRCELAGGTSPACAGRAPAGGEQAQPQGRLGWGPRAARAARAPALQPLVLDSIPGPAWLVAAAALLAVLNSVSGYLVSAPPPLRASGLPGPRALWAASHRRTHLC